MRKPTNFIAPLILLCLSWWTVSCGTIVGNPEEDEDDPLGPPAVMLADLPDVRGISLTSLGTGQGLMALGDCSGTAGMGAFSMIYAPACALAQVTSSSMYGENPDKNDDDRITCEEYETGKENGILYPLLCEESMTSRSEVTSLRYTENDSELAISFLPNADHGIGSWTASGVDAKRYPATIRVWTGAEGNALAGVVSLLLDTPRTGTIYFDIQGEDWLVGESRFNIKEALELPDCATEQSEAGCHFEEFNFRGDQGDPNSSIGAHMVVYANKRKGADLLMIEGLYAYTAEQAESQFGSDPTFGESFKNIRTIYFRTVLQGGQVWGSLDFQNENGDTLVTEHDFDGTVIDVTKVIRNGFDDEEYAGVCVNVGEEDWVTCEDVVYTQFSDMWRGEAWFDPISASSQPIDYSELPEPGLCYLEAGDQKCL